MSDLQQRIFDIKKSHGFNIADPNMELNLIEGEIAELKQAVHVLNGTAALNDLDNAMRHTAMELADVVICCYGLSEMLGQDLEDCINTKFTIFKHRIYQNGKKVGYSLGSTSDMHYRVACADALNCPLRRITDSHIVQCRIIYSRLCKQFKLDTPEFFTALMECIIMELGTLPLNPIE